MAANPKPIQAVASVLGKNIKIKIPDTNPLQLNPVAALLAAAIMAGGYFISTAFNDRQSNADTYILAASAFLAVFALLSLKIAKQWERVIVLKLGKFDRLKGPGIFFIIPIIETLIRTVDMRIRSTDFNSESTLTKDTVPVNVAARQRPAVRRSRTRVPTNARTREVRPEAAGNPGWITSFNRVIA